MTPEPGVDWRVALVTGASAGIGRAIAVALGALGWTVAIGARRETHLEETAELVAGAGGTPVVHPLDVTDPASIDAFLDAVRGAAGTVDVLVNNAGTALPGAIHDMSDADHRRIVETNLLGPMLLTRRIVGALRTARTSGDVVFISSDTTVHPRPSLATYLSTKAGLEAFAHVLALESEGAGIRSSIVRVGPTLSGFADGWDLAIFEELMPRWQRFGIQRHFNTMQPEDVARAVVTVVTAPAHMWVPIVEVQPTPP
ncbi:MAG TPA: SDR family NAD(P)-dependent oxidoreductase, partial [Acidimicrobiia bacterium]|nr:SDR family NAD(P)-dependent oxidoreductase [Acidimicrobiia bacterium]